MPTEKYIQYERSDPIKIKKKTNEGEYSLKLNFFDPTKHSPPNVFLNTLQHRMDKYYHNEVNKDCKRIKE